MVKCDWRRVQREITFHVSEADVLHAYRLWYWRRMRSGTALPIYLIAALLVGGIVAAIARQAGGVAGGMAAFGGLVGACLGAGGMIALSLAGIRVSVRKAYAQQRMLREAYTVTWDEAGITVTTATSHNHHPWSDFHGWCEDAHILLLFQSDSAINFIPQTAASPAQKADFLALLHHHVGAKPR